MKQIITRIAALFMVSLLAVSLAACGGKTDSNVEMTETTPSASENAQVIRVGFVYPKTGVYASFGEYTGNPG